MCILPCMTPSSSLKVAWKVKHAVRSANSFIFDKSRRNLKYADIVFLTVKGNYSCAEKVIG